MSGIVPRRKRTENIDNNDKASPRPFVWGGSKLLPNSPSAWHVAGDDELACARACCPANLISLHDRFEIEARAAGYGAADYRAHLAEMLSWAAEGEVGENLRLRTRLLREENIGRNADRTPPSEFGE